MAVTVEDLLADIEKRMVALGYEDFEELYSQDHDIQSLKELKRKLMDDAKALREEKKLKTRWTKELRDVLVKLSKVYKKDFYIYNGSIVIPGKISQESLKGKFILTIKDEFQECIKRILFNDEENRMIFIRELSEFKSLIDEFLECEEAILTAGVERSIIEVCDINKTLLVKDKMDIELESIKLDSEKFKPLEIDDTDVDIISTKKLFEMKYDGYPPIEGNIQLFPFYNEKDRPDVEFMCGDFEKRGLITLYYARFHVDYQYFDIYFKIYFF